MYTDAKQLRVSSYPRSRMKGSSLPRYNNGGQVAQYMAANQGALSGAANMLSGGIMTLDQLDGKTSPWATAGAGALKGASAGMAFGPWGAAIGAGIGLIGGAIGGSMKSKAEEEALRKQEEAKRKAEQAIADQKELAALSTSKAILQTYPTSGVANAGFAMAEGGPIKGLAGVNANPELTAAVAGLQGGPAQTATQYQEPSGWDQFKNVMNAPLTSLGYAYRGQEIPNNVQPESAVDNVLSAFNPFSRAVGAVDTIDGVVSGDMHQAVEGVANIIPAGRVAKTPVARAGLNAAYSYGVGQMANGGPVPTPSLNPATAKALNAYGAANYPTTPEQKAALYGYNGYVQPQTGALRPVEPVFGAIMGTHLASEILGGHMTSGLAAAHRTGAGTAAKAAGAVKDLYNGYEIAHYGGLPFHAYGGKIAGNNAAYLAEDQEIIQHAHNDKPDTDENGGIQKLNSTASKFVGDTHDDPSNGIGARNDQDARIYSNRLYAPKNLVAELKKL